MKIDTSPYLKIDLAVRHNDQSLTGLQYIIASIRVNAWPFIVTEANIPLYIVKKRSGAIINHSNIISIIYSSHRLPQIVNQGE